MAKPDCDDGYYKLSYELAAALMTFGFGEIEGFILGRVLEQQYGWAKKKMVHIRTCEVATLLDVDRRLVNRAIHKLVGVGVLETLGDDCYTFIKDYESWETPHWRQAKRDRWILFARRAPMRAKADRPKATPKDRDDLIQPSDGPSEDVISKDDKPPVPVIFKDDKSEDTDDSVSSSKMTDCHLQSRQLVISKDDNAGVPPGPPIGEARAECKKLRREEEYPPTPQGGFEVEGEQFCCDPPETIPMPKPSAPGVPQTYDELYAWVGRSSRNPVVIEGLPNLAAGYAPDWVFQALRVAMFRKRDENDWCSYANGCLRRWHTRGSIDEAEVKRETASRSRDYGQPTAVTDEDREFLERRKAAMARTSKGA